MIQSRPGMPNAMANRSLNPMANANERPTMNPNAPGLMADPTIGRPGGVPSGMRGLPQPMQGGFGGPPQMSQLPPALMQNPQFLQLLQQLMMEQQQQQGGGFSRNIFGR